MRKRKDKEREELEQQFLQEIAISILEASKGPILLSAQVDDILHTRLVVEQIMKELFNTITPLLDLSPRYKDELPHAIRALKKVREERSKDVSSPFKVHKDCIIEQA